MRRPNRRTLTVTGIGLAAATGVLGITLAGPGSAFADPSASPSASASAGTRADKRAQEKADYAAALAKELGIDEAKVQAAMDKVDADRAAANKTERHDKLKAELDAAVKAGTLTQAEADAILKASDAGVLPGGGAGGPGGRGRGGR